MRASPGLPTRRRDSTQLWKQGVGIWPPRSLLVGNVFSMRVVAAIPTPCDVEQRDTETVVLSEAQLDFLGTVSERLNPDMPMAFGGAHVIRTLLERIEEAGVDLADAKDQEEITRLAADALRKLRQPR